MKKYLLIGAAFAAFAPAAAMAQEAETWTGGHVDAIVGWDKFSNDDPAISSTPTNKDGVTYGGQVGFDYDTGSVVLGLEGEYADSSVKECSTGGTTTVCLKAGRDLYAGARVGVAVGDNRSTLLYLKGGYANGGYTVESTTAGTTTSADFDDDGYRVGVGVEQRLSSNLTAKVEYRYSDYGDFNTRNQVVVGMGLRF